MGERLGALVEQNPSMQKPEVQSSPMSQGWPGWQGLHSSPPQSMEVSELSLTWLLQERGTTPAMGAAVGLPGPQRPLRQTPDKQSAFTPQVPPPAQPRQHEPPQSTSDSSMF